MMAGLGVWPELESPAKRNACGVWSPALQPSCTNPWETTTVVWPGFWQKWLPLQPGRGCFNGRQPTLGDWAFPVTTCLWAGSGFYPGWLRWFPIRGWHWCWDPEMHQLRSGRGCGLCSWPALCSLPGDLTVSLRCPICKMGLMLVS